MAADLDRAQLMLLQFNQESIKLSKTKVKTNINDDRDIKIGYTVIGFVESYVYLCHKLKLGIDNQTSEIM